MEHGYHGHTQTGIDISDYKFSSIGGEGKKEFILKTPLPDTYRGKYRENEGDAGELYARDAIKQIRSADSPMAAFVSEPVVGCGGQVPLARGYLKEISKLLSVIHGTEEPFMQVRQTACTQQQTMAAPGSVLTLTLNIIL